jgi:hypothetical protein
MAEDKKELELPNQTSGFTLKELDDIEKYKEAGLPGIIDVTDEKLMSAFGMRLDGMRFQEIARSLSLKKVQVMYLADKYNWHERRIEYLDGLEMHIKDQVIEQKIRSKGFIMKAMHVMNRRMSKKFDRYLSTGDESIGDSIDMEEMSLYLKMTKAISDLDAAGLARNPENNQSLIGINAGESGVTMKRLDDGSVEITPRQKSHAEMLAELAKSKREQKNNPENK